jgi:Septum formation initiator
VPTHPIAAVPNSDSERGRLLARATIAALLLALVALQLRLWTGAASLAEVATLEARVSAQQAENRRLAEQNALLETEVRALKEDPDSLEARARSELGMIREGETFFMVLPPAQDAAGEP